MTFANCNKVLIALGANSAESVQDNAASLRQALDRIAVDVGRLGAVSSLWRTPAYPPGAGPEFVNACARIETTLTAGGVLSALHAIEADLGRVRRTRWEARAIDLDLLAMGDMILPDMATQRAWMDLAPDRQRAEAPDRLILPHPRLHQRGFVLVPLAEVAPDWVHPVLGVSVQVLRDGLDPAELAGIRPIAQN